jgi:hypothetical protein
MAIDTTTMSSVVIEGNTFDFGNFATDVNAEPTAYGYNSCILTNADARIGDNYFSAALSSSIPVQITGAATCQISKNTFVRVSTPLTAYIDISSVTSDQVITENIFDNPTVDGFNENLVSLPPAGVSATSPFILYERNKNQTAIKQVQKSPYKLSLAAFPTINPSERTAYVDDTATAYVPASGFYTGNFIPSFFKHEGVSMNYTTPFSPTTAIKLPGIFGVTNGSASVTTLGAEPVVYTSVASGTLIGYVVFGNDNQYYSVTATTTSNVITSMTLATPYTGNTAIVSAVYFPTGAPLSTTLIGTFHTISGNPAVTATISQSQLLAVGSKIYFNDNSSNIYTITSIDSSGTNLTISPNATSSNSAITASAGAVTTSINFSINLSEILPPNVQVLSTIFGVYGGGVVTPSILFAQYNGNITTDAGGNFSSNLAGTFTVTNSSATVIATNSQAGVIAAGSSICFSSQPYVVYPVQSVSGTTITLATTYSNPNASGVTATYFDNTLADAVHYNIAGSTTVGFGNNIALTIGNTVGAVPPSAFNTFTQYLKIDPPSFGFSVYTSSGRLTRYNLNIFIVMQAPGSLFFPESPLIIKYRW